VNGRFWRKADVHTQTASPDRYGMSKNGESAVPKLTSFSAKASQFTALDVRGDIMDPDCSRQDT
jgi:hypothetical protein